MIWASDDMMLLMVIAMFVSTPVIGAPDTPLPKKFDEFSDICCEDERARLDAFALALQQQPGAQGYIIFYGGQRYTSCCYGGQRCGPKRPRVGEAAARAARLKRYLVDQRGIVSARLELVNGGYRESWMAELWTVPEGATPPGPAPTLERRDIKFRKGRVTLREFQVQCV